MLHKCHFFVAHNAGCLFVFLPVLTDYLRGDVLPVEQHAASDLPSLLHLNAHLKALMDIDALHCTPMNGDFSF